ncbi:uncharacterized protein V1518DRAFT_409150 [Limtongia smithiae]|uniref:uncharacterized protein n=1 Tax=Limtongia smithiae TaxID=1125753 RepID=UPI0034CD508A
MSWQPPENVYDPAHPPQYHDAPPPAGPPPYHSMADTASNGAGTGGMPPSHTDSAPSLQYSVSSAPVGDIKVATADGGDGPGPALPRRPPSSTYNSGITPCPEPPTMAPSSASSFNTSQPPAVASSTSSLGRTPTPHTPDPGFAQPGKNGVVNLSQTYHTIPSNGTFFGPYLRYGNIDLQKGIWYGSVLLVIDSEAAPYFQIHPTEDLAQMRAIDPILIYQFQNYRFFRYNLQLTQLPDDRGQYWTYAITHLGVTFTYPFLVAGARETSWRFVAFSCADFSLSVKEEERRELGGVGYLWEDVLTQHRRVGGLHAMLGGGDQIYADRMWPEIASLQDWLHTKGKENRRRYEWTPRLEDDMNLAYFFFYTSHFDRAGIRDCLAQIPNLFQIDDHDIFDGFGSYPDYMQKSNLFTNIGRIAFQFYMLFQHHTTEHILHTHAEPWDLFTVTGRGWHFIKYMGPECAVVGPDTRAEREMKSIIGEATHRELFRRMEALPTSIRHIVLMLAVPIVYPRLTMVEHVLSGVKNTKRAVNGAWNMLGKATTKVAAVVGAGDATRDAFENAKKAFGKSGMMSSLVSGFGEVDLLDDLADHWTHENHSAERTYFVRNLQRIAKDRGIRITFVSGDVHCCGMGRFFNPDMPENYELMYQVITSAISNVPPPSAVIRLLHNKDKLYLPEINGQSIHTKTDTREEMLEFFSSDVDGTPLDNRKLLGRRNYSIAEILPDHSMTWNLYVQLGAGRYGSMERTRIYGPLIVPPLPQDHGPTPQVYSQYPYNSSQQSVPAGVYGPGELTQGVQNMNLHY